MNHAKRLSYFNQMGIDGWVARRPLQGAKQGHLLASVAVSDSVAVAPKTTQAISSHSGQSQKDKPKEKVLVRRGLAVAEMLDLGADPSANPKPARSADETNIKPQPQTLQDSSQHDISQMETSLRFKLQSILLSDLLIVDDIGEVNLVASAYQNWFESIAFALNKEVVTIQDHFAWPLENATLFDNTKTAAKEVLQAWLLRKLQEAEVKRVLLMGRAAAEYLSNTDNVEQSYGVEAKLPFASFVSVKLTFGTSQIWQDPLLKRKFWQHLQTMDL